MNRVVAWLTKKPKRHQNCLVLCEDRRIEMPSLPVEKGYIVDEKTHEAWHLINLSGYLLPMQGEADLYQLISERDAVPLNPFSGDGIKPDTVAIAREEFYKALGEVEKDNKKTKLMSAIVFAVLSVVATFVLTVLVTLFTSGKVHF